ncbi:MAG: histidinol-phosphate transaminase [Clostridia bacterium]|nr:histidinol-phosphate transaminase [Clostridia bacterium]
MSRFLKEQYQKLEAYTPGEQPRDMVYIKLNTNESPFPPAPEVVAAMTAEQVENLRLYSDPTAKGLKEKLAGLYGVSAEQIFLTNGSDDILNFAFMAWGQKGAIFPDITYGFYPVFAELHGVEYTEIPLNSSFSINKEDYLNKNKLIVIANPNAPTGISMGVETIEEILRTNPDCPVVIDEAYVDFGGVSCYKLTERYENLLVVRTFSKSRCLAGGRLGYAIGAKGLIEDLEKIKYSTNPYNINRLTMLLGEATVDAEAYYQEKCREIMRVRGQTAERLKALGFTVLPSDANFLFAKSEKISGETLYSELKKRGILVRHFTKERIKDFNRITIGTEAQMQAFCTAVAAILEEQV